MVNERTQNERTLIKLEERFNDLNVGYDQFEKDLGYLSRKEIKGIGYRNEGYNVRLSLSSIINNAHNNISKERDDDTISRNLEMGKIKVEVSEVYLDLLKNYSEFREAELSGQEGYFCIRSEKEESAKRWRMFPAGGAISYVLQSEALHVGDESRMKDLSEKYLENLDKSRLTWSELKMGGLLEDD